MLMNKMCIQVIPWMISILNAFLNRVIDWDKTNECLVTDLSTIRCVPGNPLLMNSSMQPDLTVSRTYTGPICFPWLHGEGAHPWTCSLRPPSWPQGQRSQLLYGLSGYIWEGRVSCESAFPNVSSRCGAGDRRRWRHAGREREEPAGSRPASAGLQYDDWQATAQDQRGVRAWWRATGGAQHRCVFSACCRKIKEATENQTLNMKTKQTVVKYGKVSVRSSFPENLMSV